MESGRLRSVTRPRLLATSPRTAALLARDTGARAASTAFACSIGAGGFASGAAGGRALLSEAGCAGAGLAVSARLSHDPRLSRRRRCRGRRFRFRALSGDSRRSRRRRVGFRRRSVRSLVAALEGHHFGEFVAPRLIHQRPVTRDVGRLPRRRRRQRGGRGHHLRLSVRQHAGLDDGLRRAMRPIQDSDRGNGDAGCKRGRERALALQERTLCFAGGRDLGAVPTLTVVDDRMIAPRDGRLLRLAVSCRASSGRRRGALRFRTDALLCRALSVSLAARPQRWPAPSPSARPRSLRLQPAQALSLSAAR